MAQVDGAIDPIGELAMRNEVGEERPDARLYFTLSRRVELRRAVEQVRPAALDERDRQDGRRDERVHGICPVDAICHRRPAAETAAPIAAARDASHARCEFEAAFAESVAT